MLDAGGSVVQETRHWHEDTGLTTSGRSKEEAEDYRYFPEPDLVPIAPSREWVDALRATAARLRSEAHGVPLRFEKDTPAELVQRETAAYQSRVRAVNESVQGLRESKRLLDREIETTVASAFRIATRLSPGSRPAG